jgi:hypothetical protein
MKIYAKFMNPLPMTLLLGVFMISCGGGGGGGYPSSETATSPTPGTPITTLDLAVLNAGGYYLQVHTVNFPDGEVRGQINVPSGATGTVTISTSLNGGSEVPPVATAGTGTGTLVVDLSTGAVSSASITVSGMSSAVNAAHIHQGAAGANGPVVVPVTVTTAGGGVGIGIGY